MKACESLPPFDPRGWLGYRVLQVSETHGLPRPRTVVQVPFDVPAAQLSAEGEAALRLVLQSEGVLSEVPAQWDALQHRDGQLAGRAVFLVDDLPARGCREFRLYFGHPAAPPPDRAKTLLMRSGDRGPQHRWIENEFYKVETMPWSGQIWHLWNKTGSNTSWHHNEWDTNKDKGGDPCHWAPNCWAAYPERITNGYDVMTGGEDIDLIDWNYAFGWRDPQTEIVCGPVFCEIRRQGVVWPHPEHSNPGIRRDPAAFVRAEVVYRFYAGLPWFHQSSVLETQKDMRVFFIRNCQFVFLSSVFTHTFLAPERDGILATDDEEVAVLRLMGKINRKPYPHQQHSLSNVLPSKLAYTGFVNDETADGFALFQLAERNRNLHRGEPVYRNHATLLSELSGWSAYYCRAFSYTNQRYNPENAVFLPRGERYEEENACLVFRHRDWPGTLESVRHADRCLKQPLAVAQGALRI